MQISRLFRCVSWLGHVRSYFVPDDFGEESSATFLPAESMGWGLSRGLDLSDLELALPNPNSSSVSLDAVKELVVVGM
jgi:hypothetical protein